MLEDEGDWGAEVLGVSFAHKSRDNICEQDGGDPQQQTLVCLTQNCLLLLL